jgi:hypothetical protein
MAIGLQRKSSHWTERLAIASVCLLCALLVQLTLWKESELFWMNIGGYPIWLRDSVHTLYYPYLFFVLASILMVTWSVVNRFLQELSVSRVWALLLGAWIVLFACLGLLVTNNVMNLVNERPIHYHDWEQIEAVQSEDL